MKLKVLNKDGQDTGREINLSDEVFAIEPNDHVVWLAVRQYQAAGRQGTHKTKERWEVARTTKKAFRQKGTGGARRGSMKSPVVKGGGRAFGPRPHGYDFKLNKKVKDLARMSALTYKAQDGNIIVIEDLRFEAAKTKDFVKVLNSLNLHEDKCVFVLTEPTANTILSSRNIPNAYVADATQLNVWDIMNPKKLVLSEGAVKAIEANFSNN